MAQIFQTSDVELTNLASDHIYTYEYFQSVNDAFGVYEEFSQRTGIPVYERLLRAFRRWFNIERFWELFIDTTRLQFERLIYLSARRARSVIIPRGTLSGYRDVAQIQIITDYLNGLYSTIVEILEVLNRCNALTHDLMQTVKRLLAETVYYLVALLYGTTSLKPIRSTSIRSVIKAVDNDFPYNNTIESKYLFARDILNDDSTDWNAFTRTHVGSPSHADLKSAARDVVNLYETYEQNASLSSGDFVEEYTPAVNNVMKRENVLFELFTRMYEERFGVRVSRENSTAVMAMIRDIDEFLNHYRTYVDHEDAIIREEQLDVLKQKMDVGYAHLTLVRDLDNVLQPKLLEFTDTLGRLGMLGPKVVETREIRSRSGVSLNMDPNVTTIVMDNMWKPLQDKPNGDRLIDRTPSDERAFMFINVITMFVYGTLEFSARMKQLVEMKEQDNQALITELHRVLTNDIAIFTKDTLEDALVNLLISLPMFDSLMNRRNEMDVMFLNFWGLYQRNAARVGNNLLLY